jgi:hypothetical protein
MKLEPKAKPVRIRIKSGGEEHFSLDSLKRNFSVQDLWEAVRGKSLSRWLRQQNEIELADNIDAYREIEKPTIEEYVDFCSLFYKDNVFGDVNSLIDYYQSKGLQKNLQYVLVYVFDSLDYEKGKTWFYAYRSLKRDEDWIDFFEKRLDALNDMDVVDCHRLLAALYNDQGEEKKKVFHLKKASAQLNIMAKSNDKFLPNLLEIGDYQCVKSLFDDPVTQGKVETKKWIESFRRCKESLFGQEQGECLYILSTLYEKVQDNNMSKMCLKMAESAGFKIEKKEPQALSFRYPKLSNLILSYKKNINRDVKVDDLTTISSRLWDFVPGDKYIEVCYECLVLYATVNITSRAALIGKRQRIIDIMSRTKPLVYIVAALAWEERTKSKDLYGISKSAIPANYWKLFEIKQFGKEVVITSECGLRCNTVRDTNIDQMFFFMQTFGEQYSYEHMN